MTTLNIRQINNIKWEKLDNSASRKILEELKNTVKEICCEVKTSPYFSEKTSRLLVKLAQASEKVKEGVEYLRDKGVYKDTTKIAEIMAPAESPVAKTSGEFKAAVQKLFPLAGNYYITLQKTNFHFCQNKKNLDSSENT